MGVENSVLMPIALATLKKRPQGRFFYTVVIEICSSAIAQLVEQMTVNHWVPGSSPGRGAIFKPVFWVVSSVGRAVGF